MVKTWQYYFLIRDLNVSVKMMNAHLCKHLPPEARLEPLGGAYAQQDLKRPSLMLCWSLSMVQALPRSQGCAKRQTPGGCISFLLTNAPSPSYLEPWK
jgi:hypothetical protein